MTSTTTLVDPEFISQGFHILPFLAAIAVVVVGLAIRGITGSNLLGLLSIMFTTLACM